MSYRKYTEEMLREAVKNSDSFVGVVRFLDVKPNYRLEDHIARMVRKFGIDHSHFISNNIQDRFISNKKIAASEILVLLPQESGRAKAPRLRRALLEMGVEEKCNHCQQDPEWQGKFLRLEINHIDGNWRNCLFENLEFICPNCHSQEVETNRPHKSKSK